MPLSIIIQLYHGGQFYCPDRDSNSATDHSHNGPLEIIKFVKPYMFSTVFVK